MPAAGQGAAPGQGAVGAAARSTAGAHPQWVGPVGFQSWQSHPKRRAL